MNRITAHFRRLTAYALLGACIAAWPAFAAAQTVTGAATAVKGGVLGVTTALADTGYLTGEEDAREASEQTAGILSLGSATVLHATTISSIDGWDAEDYVASEASLADLALTVAGNSISTAFVMASALAPVGGSPTGTSDVTGLAINGMPVDVTGQPNQTVPLLGGRVILNEQVPSAGGTTVNALHIVIDGLADLVIASASAGVGSGGSTTPSPLPPLPLF